MTKKYILQMSSLSGLSSAVPQSILNGGGCIVASVGQHAI